MKPGQIRRPTASRQLIMWGTAQGDRGGWGLQFGGESWRHCLTLGRLLLRRKGVGGTCHKARQNGGFVWRTALAGQPWQAWTTVHVRPQCFFFLWRALRNTGRGKKDRPVNDLRTCGSSKLQGDFTCTQSKDHNRRAILVPEAAELTIQNAWTAKPGSSGHATSSFGRAARASSTAHGRDNGRTAVLLLEASKRDQTPGDAPAVCGLWGLTARGSKTLY